MCGKKGKAHELKNIASNTMVVVLHMHELPPMVPIDRDLSTRLTTEVED